MQTSSHAQSFVYFPDHSFCLGQLISILLWPRKPTAAVAVAHVTEMLSRTAVISGYMFVSEEIEVTHLVSDLPTVQLVVSKHVQKTVPASSEEQCLMADFVTSSLLMGPKQDGRLEGQAYAVVGMPVDEQIKAVQGTWRDGAMTGVPVQNGTFLFLRPDDDLRLDSVVGLDDQRRVLLHTQTAYESLDFTPTEYEVVARYPLDDGLVIAETFTIGGAELLHCLELSYYPGENMAQQLRGNPVLTGQRHCVSAANDETVLPAMLATINNDLFIAGRVLSNRVAQVVIEWSDGFRQLAEVREGVYLAERDDTTAFIVTQIGLDRAGDPLRKGRSPAWLTTDY